MKLEHPKDKIAIMIMFALFMFLVAISSCTVYKTPKPQITHVLAITSQGDTLKLPIDVIRPIYNYNNISYPRTNYYPYNHMYYNYNNYTPIYKNKSSDKVVPNTTNTTPPRIQRSGSGKINTGNPAKDDPRKNN